MRPLTDSACVWKMLSRSTSAATSSVISAQQRVALLLGQLAVGDRQAEQDLDVDLVVGGVDAGRVVDRVGVDAPARQRVLDAPELRAAEVAAFGDHLAAQLARR